MYLGLNSKKRIKIIKSGIYIGGCVLSEKEWIFVRNYDDYQSAQITTMKAELPVKLTCSN